MQDFHNHQEVELSTAFYWNCPNCSEDNFAMPLRVELVDDEAEDVYRQLNDLESWQELPDGWRNFEVLQIPEDVVCADCGKTFTAIDESSP